MYWAAIYFAYLGQTINRIAGYIEEAAIDCIAGWHCNGNTCVNNFHAASKPFSTVHCNGTNAVFAKVLLYFKH